MQLFYTPDIVSDSYVLDELESKHCVRVLRMTEGDSLHLTDGKGNLYKAVISLANPKACHLTLVEKFPEYEKRACRSHIAMAPTKNNERFEWFLEKATEIGIDEITPLICEKSERSQINTGRFERIIVSAIKQSIKAYKPILNEAKLFKTFINQSSHAFRCIAHCHQGEKQSLKSLISHQNNVLILIGPEGDFSMEEVKMAITQGFTPVSLGNSRLRTETAGIVACHTIQLMNN